MRSSSTVNALPFPVVDSPGGIDALDSGRDRQRKYALWSDLNLTPYNQCPISRVRHCYDQVRVKHILPRKKHKRKRTKTILDDNIIKGDLTQGFECVIKNRIMHQDTYN